MSSTRFCSFTVDTTVPPKKRDGWVGLFFLQENHSSVDCLFGSGLIYDF